MNRICAEVQAELPDHVAGEQPWWRRRLVAVHLRRCADCQAELARQRTVLAGLAALGDVSDDDLTPPDDLLDRLLAQADRPGLRGRAAGPARGAISGARPGLSAAFLVAGAAVGTAAGYATWRGAKAVKRRVSRS
ncbi:MAG: zf-HC2 domain-containing protein [Actinobacteria bacterium]|nr:zf-HC2 domain-containing protein [Actinomycetota bacterium]